MACKEGTGPKKEPWWNWPERWQIAEDYAKGMPIWKLAIKYRHDRRRLRDWVAALGLLRPRPEAKVPVAAPDEHHIMESVRRLGVYLLLSQRLLGRPLRFDEISRLMKVVRSENKGQANGDISWLRRGVPNDAED